jgi:hypothetical protein
VDRAGNNCPWDYSPNDAIADQVIKLLRSTYADFGPTLAVEKLRTNRGIDLAKDCEAAAVRSRLMDPAEAYVAENTSTEVKMMSRRFSRLSATCRSCAHIAALDLKSLLFETKEEGSSWVAH